MSSRVCIFWIIFAGFFFSVFLVLFWQKTTEAHPTPETDVQYRAEHWLYEDYPIIIRVLVYDDTFKANRYQKPIRGMEITIDPNMMKSGRIISWGSDRVWITVEAGKYNYGDRIGASNEP